MDAPLGAAQVVAGPPLEQKERWYLPRYLEPELQQRGIDTNASDWLPRALKENPEIIFQWHQDALNEGADMVMTASIGASLDGFIKYGMYQREARETIFSTVMLACMAREKYFTEKGSRPIPVVGAIGSYGAYFYGGQSQPAALEGKYWQNERLSIDACDLSDYYDPLIEILLAPRKSYRVDFLFFDSLPAEEEARDVLARMKKYPNARCMMSFSRVDAALKAQPFLDKDAQILAWGLSAQSEEGVDVGLRELYIQRQRWLNENSDHHVFKPLIARPWQTENVAIRVAWFRLGVRIFGQ